ncbi:MAG: permease-like cell division protein FtsX [Bdellovibrionota bacterium]
MILRVVWNHFRSRPFSNFLTLVAIAFCLGLLGGFWALSDNLKLLHASKGAAEGEMSVFVDSSLPQEKADAIEKSLRSFPWVGELTLVASSDSIKILKDRFGESLTSNLGDKSLPTTWRVKMKNSVTDKELQSSIDSIRNWEGVIDIDLGGDLWSGDMSKGTAGTLSSWSNLLFLVVFVVVILLVSHITRIAFEASRDDVETLTLMGASKRWIFAPLLVESCIMGLVGSLMGLFITVLFLKYGLPPLSEVLFDKITPIQELSWNALWKILSLGVFASVVGAFLTWPLVASSGPRSS